MAQWHEYDAIVWSHTPSTTGMLRQVVGWWQIRLNLTTFLTRPEDDNILLCLAKVQHYYRNTDALQVVKCIANLFYFMKAYVWFLTDSYNY